MDSLVGIDLSKGAQRVLDYICEHGEDGVVMRVIKEEVVGHMAMTRSYVKELKEAGLVRVRDVVVWPTTDGKIVADEFSATLATRSSDSHADEDPAETMDEALADSALVVTTVEVVDDGNENADTVDDGESEAYVLTDDQLLEADSACDKSDPEEDEQADSTEDVQTDTAEELVHDEEERKEEAVMQVTMTVKPGSIAHKVLVTLKDNDGFLEADEARKELERLTGVKYGSLASALAKLFNAEFINEYKGDDGWVVNKIVITDAGLAAIPEGDAGISVNDTSVSSSSSTDTHLPQPNAEGLMSAGEPTSNSSSADPAPEAQGDGQETLSFTETVLSELMPAIETIVREALKGLEHELDINEEELRLERLRVADLTRERDELQRLVTERNEQQEALIAQVESLNARLAEIAGLAHQPAESD